MGRLEEGGGDAAAAAAEHRYVVARAQFLSRSESHSHQKGMIEKLGETVTWRETLHNQTSGRDPGGLPDYFLHVWREEGGRTGGGGSPGNFLGERLGLVGRWRRNRLIEISMRWNDIGDRIADTNLSRTELAIKLIINHE